MNITTQLLSELGVLRLFNGGDNALMDQVAVLLTSGVTWIPLYIGLVCIIIRNNETMAQIGLAVGGALVCVLLTTTVADGVVKPLVERLRPCNDPMVKYTVFSLAGSRPSDYSFFSAHAANTMGVAVFTLLLMRSRAIGVLMVGWSLLNCWTRLYLGVHWPTDILVGILFGALVGAGVYLGYRKLYLRISPNIKYISNQYSVTGYDYDDIDIVLSVAALTLVYVLLRALYMTSMI